MTGIQVTKKEKGKEGKEKRKTRRRKKETRQGSILFLVMLFPTLSTKRNERNRIGCPVYYSSFQLPSHLETSYTEIMFTYTRVQVTHVHSTISPVRSGGGCSVVGARWWVLGGGCSSRSRTTVCAFKRVSY